MHSTPTPQHDPAPGMESPISNVAPASPALCGAALLNRVGRVLQDLSAARQVSDAEIRQHAADCTALMEAAYDRFLAHQDPADREEACLWMHRRDEALRSLSPAWKAAREAQIQQDIAQGTGCFFMDEADAARQALRGGSR